MPGVMRLVRQVLVFHVTLDNTATQEDQNFAAKYLKNSSVERWRSVHGSETRTLHQSTTLKKELPSIAHATRVKYVGKRITFRTRHGPEGWSSGLALARRTKK